VRDRSGHPHAVILAGIDLTERREAEEERAQLEAQLRQSHKLEALGTLAGGIAHDFNNILLAIFGYCELAREDLPEGSDARCDIEMVLASAKRAQRLVGQILTFSRRNDGQRDLISLDDVVRESLPLIRASLPTTIQIHDDITAGNHTMLGDASQVHQILLNLSTNAAHAMNHRGMLEITVEEVGLAEPIDACGRTMPGGLYTCLTVRDSGCGMDESTLERVFEPFFTTKEVGKGTGLGLSVVHGIVRSHGGAVSVDTEPGAGAAFRCYFPTVASGLVGPHPRPDEECVSCGTERLLVVEDEEELATLAQNMLERLGYQVHTTTNSIEALALFHRDPVQFAAVVTDQTMPGRTGLELATELQRIRPGLPVVLTTGFSEAVTPERIAAACVSEVVMKPFTTETIGRAVRLALDRADPPDQPAAGPGGPASDPTP
jgi:nitrogen-specific signal transduction histidine kinase/CheY-like chemotaxis protein